MQEGAASDRSTRVRLDFLDGLRGLAALYVVFYHAFSEVDYRWQTVLPHGVLRATEWMLYGHSAVAVFIVLSGFCLMLPVAGGSSQSLNGGFLGFMKRRARRILPPYYAAMILSVLVILATTRLQGVPDTFWDYALPALTPAALIPHVLLVNDLNPAWMYTLNPPMWSVALEWQIYFFFPIILLPVWRRFGVLASLVCAFAFGLAPHFLLPADRNLDWTFPWYLGLFGLGMAGAALRFSTRYARSVLLNKTPWGTICALAAVLFLALDRIRWLRSHLPWLYEVRNGWIDDIIVGVEVICLILYCTGALSEPDRSRKPIMLRILEARWIAALGGFSYSLYLVHDPILAMAHLAMTMHRLSPTISLLLLTALVIPLCILVAYLFHRVFERPFMNVPGRAKQAPSPFRLSKSPPGR